MSNYDFAERSWLRKRDRDRIRNPRHEAHVFLWMQTYTPQERQPWICPACGKSSRKGDRLRNACGRLAKHCGCRVGCCGRRPNSKSASKTGFQSKSAEHKKQCRLRGLPGFKLVQFDSHVKQWKSWQILQKRQLMTNKRRVQLTASEINELQKQQQRRLTKDLTDGYVSKRLKKNMPGLKGVDLPSALIALERIRLMIKRELKQRT